MALQNADQPVHEAARAGLAHELSKMLAADASLIDAKGIDARTPLHCAGTVAVAALLLDYGARIDARDEDHDSTPAYGWAGQYERGIQASQEAIRLDGTVPFPYPTIAINNLCLNRFEEAADSLRLGAERKFEIPEFLVNRYYLAFLRGDQAGMEREIARASGTAVE